MSTHDTVRHLTFSQELTGSSEHKLQQVTELRAFWKHLNLLIILSHEF